MGGPVFRILPVGRSNSHIRFPGVHHEAAGDLHALQAHATALRGPGLLQVSFYLLAILAVLRSRSF
jgi:hypothetical protein